MAPTAIAKAAYEIEHAYCQATGDCSRGPWSGVAEWLKAYMVARVEFLLSGEEWPEAPHASWLKAEREESEQAREVKDKIFRAVVRELSAPREDIG